MRKLADDVAAGRPPWEGSPTNASSKTGLFAEGRLMHVHLFEDSNGRVARLSMVELQQVSACGSTIP